ncbi:MAG: NAD(P)/FAD-dependent oxidoreductase [Gemmatimonadaceae bacterium]
MRHSWAQRGDAHFPMYLTAVCSHVISNTLTPVVSGIVVAAPARRRDVHRECAAHLPRQLLLPRLLPCRSWIRHASWMNCRTPLYARLAVVVALVLGVGAATRARGILDTIIIFNYPYMGSMLVPLLGGLLWRGATARGAFAAMAVGGAIGVAAFLAGAPGPLHRLFNVDLALLAAFAVSAAVLVAVSLAGRQPAAQVSDEPSRGAVRGIRWETGETSCSRGQLRYPETARRSNRSHDIHFVLMTIPSVPWPYPVEYRRAQRIETSDVVVGGGAAGCMAASGAAEAGARVLVIEKASTVASGASGSGSDHWESAATNPTARR